jgi:hypothetical protein
MQASAADCALTYFTTPKRQLVAWTVVGLTTDKFKPLMLPVGVSVGRLKPAQ